MQWMECARRLGQFRGWMFMRRLCEITTPCYSWTNRIRLGLLGQPDVVLSKSAALVLAKHSAVDLWARHSARRAR